MKTYLINNREELSDWFSNIHIRKGDFYPFTIQVFKGDKKHRSLEANALSHVWYRDIAKQAGDRTTLEVRRECKLNHGVGILRADDEAFGDMFDKVIDGHSYETKLEMMDYISVTSIMTVPQMSEYLDDVYHTYTAAGYFIARH